MPMPTDIGVIDLMMGIPSGDPKRWYDFLRTQLLDRESREDFEFPAQYMFKNVPHFEEHWTTRSATCSPRWTSTASPRRWSARRSRTTRPRTAIKEHPDRFFGSFEVDPNRGMEGVRELEAAVRGARGEGGDGVPGGPHAAGADQRQEVLSDLREVRGARHPDLRVRRRARARGCRSRRQDVALIDEVCWFFPELKFVTRHGCEPWADLAVKLMLKWPNLYYSTSAFAPKYYPKDVVDYANTRGADKVMYAGYFPMGLTLERIFEDMPDVPFRDHVWPKFLRENAMRVFKLDE